MMTAAVGLGSGGGRGGGIGRGTGAGDGNRNGGGFGAVVGHLVVSVSVNRRFKSSYRDGGAKGNAARGHPTWGPTF